MQNVVDVAPVADVQTAPGAVRVLHVCYEYPPLGGGGGEACRWIAEETARHDVQGVVLTAWHEGLPPKERQPNLLVRRIRCLRQKRYQCSIPEMCAYLAAAIPYAVWLHRQHRFDLVHVHFAVPSGPAGYILNRGFGVPYLMTLQGGDVPSFIPQQTALAFRLMKLLTVPVWRRAAAIFAVSEGLAELARSDYPGTDIGVIPNGVNDAFFLAPRRINGPLQLVFAGRLAVQKQLDVMLRALARLPREPAWQAHVIGDGPRGREWRNLAEQLGLRERVTFHGWLDQATLQAHLARMHVFILPSSREGLPLAGVQAMARGLTVVGSDVVGIRDLIAHERTGLLFADRDVDALARSLHGLLQEPERLHRLRVAAHAAAACYRWSAIARRYVEVYRRLHP